MPKNFLVLFGIFFSTLVSAQPTCLPIQGTVQTQAQTPTLSPSGLPVIGAEQVGTITVTSTQIRPFIQAFGQAFLIGGIHGIITGETLINGAPAVVLTHEIGFPGIGSLISTGDDAIFTGLPDDEGNVPTIETGPLAATADAGRFNGWTGNLTATGSVGAITGHNTFTYTGQLCKTQ